MKFAVGDRVVSLAYVYIPPNAEASLQVGDVAIIADIDSAGYWINKKGKSNEFGAYRNDDELELEQLYHSPLYKAMS